MKNKILYALGGLFVISVGVFLAMYWGLTPKPIPKIRLSQFVSSEEVAASVILRMRREIKEAPVLFLGVWPDDKMSVPVWSSFISQLQNNPENQDLKYDAFIMDPGMEGLTANNSVWPEHESASLIGHYDQIVLGLESAIANKKRILFIVPSTHSSQVIQNSPIDLLKEKLKITPTSFSIAPFVLTAAELKNSPVPCKGTLDEKVGTSAFGCAISYVSQLNRVKATKLPTGKMTGLMSQFGLTDYILFLRE